MAEVALVTDSTSSLEAEEARSAGVTVVPLQVVIDGKSRPESDVPAAEVATALRAGRTVSTSRPSPETFAAAYADRAEQGATAVVSVHLSAEISGTCAAAERAASAAAAASSGSEAGGVAQVAQDRAAASTTYFYVDTLEFLRRGGRIGPAAAMLGSALSVKPLLTVVDGQIRPCERVRTQSRAVARLEELSLAALAAAAGASEHVDLAVHHLDNPDGAARLVDRLQSRVRGSTVVVREVSAVIGVHVGPGMLGVVVAPRT